MNQANPDAVKLRIRVQHRGWVTKRGRVQQQSLSSNNESP